MLIWPNPFDLDAHCYGWTSTLYRYYIAGPVEIPQPPPPPNRQMDLWEMQAYYKHYKHLEVTNYHVQGSPEHKMYL